MSKTSKSSKSIYAKIIGKNNGSYPYRIGLNTLKHNGEKFNAMPDCVSGGLYFCEIKNILEWLAYGDQLCVVEPVGRVVAVDNKFKTDKLVIASITPLSEVAAWEFLFTHGLSNEKTMGDKAMRWVVKRGYVSVMEYLFSQGIDKEEALMAAVLYGHLDIVKQIVEQDATEELKVHAMYAAIEHGRLEVVKYFFDQGVPINDDDLINAAAGNYLDVVKFLIAHGVSVDEVGAHAVDVASECDASLVAEYLIVEQKVDISAILDNVLHNVVRAGDLKMVKILDERYSIDIAANDYNIINVAVENDAVDIVKYFFDRCDTAGVARMGIIAIDYDNIDVLKYLIGRGADTSGMLDRAIGYATLDTIKYIVDATAPRREDIERAMDVAFYLDDEVDRYLTAKLASL